MSEFVTQRRLRMQQEGRKLNKDIGRKVVSEHHYCFRSGEESEVIGWIHVDNYRLCYTVRYNDNETDLIPADPQLMKEAGYKFLS